MKLCCHLLLINSISDHSRCSGFIPHSTDTGSVRLQTGPDTIPLCHQSRVYFWPEAQLIVGLEDSGPPCFFFLVVSCSGLLGEEGVVEQQRSVMLNVQLSAEGCSSVGYNRSY